MHATTNMSKHGNHFNTASYMTSGISLGDYTSDDRGKFPKGEVGTLESGNGHVVETVSWWWGQWEHPIHTHSGSVGAGPV